MAARLEPPSLQHPMGTDALGRDLLTRALYGGRISLSVGFLVMGITLVIGGRVGGVAGFFGGRIDDVLMRITDAALSMPALLVLILLGALLREVDLPLFGRSSVLTVAVVIGSLSWMAVARLVRASDPRLRERGFETAHRRRRPPHPPPLAGDLPRHDDLSGNHLRQLHRGWDARRLRSIQGPAESG